MADLKHKVALVAGTTLAFAALLGGSLGIAAAGTRNTTLAVGFNLIGGPLQADVAPDKFLSCLNEASWTSLYRWDAPNQKWEHFFNESKGVPAYVNGANVGGITSIPRASGLALFMSAQVQNPQLIDSPNEACN